MTEQEAIKKLKDFKYLEYSNGIEFSSRAKEEMLVFPDDGQLSLSDFPEVMP